MIRYHASWICPISSQPVRDGTVGVERDRIAYVGPRHSAPPADTDVDLGDAILIPGLVNAHCHLELTAMRGFLDGLEFREWILRLTAARHKVMTQDMLLDSARLGVEEGLSCGITTFADTGDTGAGFDAMLERGVRGICYREVFGPDPAQSDAALSGLKSRVAEMVGRATPLVRVGVSPHAPYTVSNELFRATIQYALSAKLPVAVHIAESALEFDLVAKGVGAFADGLRSRGIRVAARGRSPIELLKNLGVLETSPLLIHCVRVDDEDIAMMMQSDCAVAHCPASNAKLGHGIAPLTGLMRSGLRIGIGSDSVASNDRMDLLDESRVAALMAGAREMRHDAIAASEVLELATLGGARALDIAGDVGSLEIGKFADLAAFPFPRHRAPMRDPVAALVFAMAGAQASFVAVAGNVLVQNGELLQPNPLLQHRVQVTADALQQWHISSLVSALPSS